MFLIAALSAGLSLRILGRAFRDRHDIWLFAAGFAAVLLLLPSYTFAQREHLGTMLILPWIAVLAARIAGERPSTALLAGAGLACGLAIVVKPHFAVIAGAVAIVGVWRLGPLRVLSSAENWMAAAVVVIYGMAIWVLFPEFFTQTLPMAAAVYLPDRLGVLTMLALPGVYLVACALVLMLALGGLRGLDALTSLLLAAAFAGGAAYLLQGKGWPYQSYPGIAFALLALLLPATRRAARLSARVVGVVASLALLASGVAWLSIDTTRNPQALANALARIGERPTIAGAGGNLSTSFPLTRLVQGTWAQRAPALWVTLAAHQIRQRPDVSNATLAALARYEAQDRETFREDMQRNRPDVLLIDVKDPHRFDWLGWLRADPGTALVLAAYAFVEQVDDVQIWRRVALPPP
jgi:hypothetical protein